MQDIQEINTMKKILLIALLFAGFQANATIIEGIIPNTFIDDNTNLVWADHTLPLGMTYADAIVWAADNGYVMATNSEVYELWTGMDSTTWYNNNVQEMIGALRQEIAYGWTSTENYYIKLRENGTSYGQERSNGHAYYAMGVWAYKPSSVVSEPSILVLMSLGLFGIGLARRRRS
jgi:hypothetical protein